jgi:hypothetical protein
MDLRRSFHVIAALALVLSPQIARAADDAEGWIQHGVKLLVQNKDQEALTCFEHAYALAPTPKAAAQLGMTERALGRWPDAERHLQEALKDEVDPWITRNRPFITEQLHQAREHLGTLEVVGPGQGVITLDGVKIGTLPGKATVRAIAGARVVRVTAAGFVAFAQVADVAAHAIVRVNVELQKVAIDLSSPGEEPAAVERPLPLPTLLPPPQARKEPGTAPREPERDFLELDSRVETMFIGGAVLGIAGVGGGSYLWATSPKNSMGFEAGRTAVMGGIALLLVDVVMVIVEHK